MTNKVFIPISVEDELPPEDKECPGLSVGVILCLWSGFMAKSVYDFSRKVWLVFGRVEEKPENAKIWLKTVELPTEEEIKNQKYIADNGYFFSDHRSFIEGANHILKLLKAK